MGITQAQWVHSQGDKHPRKEHVGWHGEMYDIQEGKWSEVSGKYVWPSTDFGCTCTSRLKVKTNIAIRESTRQRAK